eukprot:930625_1
MCGFDVIDTSNLSDNIGLLNLLVVLSPMLKHETHARILTESLKTANTGISTDDYLEILNGISRATIGTSLGLRIHNGSPIVISNRTRGGSSLLRDQGGRCSFQRLASVFRLDWRLIPDKVQGVQLPEDPKDMISSVIFDSVRCMLRSLAFNYRLITNDRFPESTIGYALTSRSLVLWLERLQYQVLDPSQLLGIVRSFLRSSDVGEVPFVRAFLLDFEVALSIRIQQLARYVHKSPLFFGELRHGPHVVRLLRFRPRYIMSITGFGSAELSLVLIRNTDILSATALVSSRIDGIPGRSGSAQPWYEDTSKFQFITNFGVNVDSGEVCFGMFCDGVDIPGFGKLHYASTAVLLMVTLLDEDGGTYLQQIHVPVMLGCVELCGQMTKDLPKPFDVTQELNIPESTSGLNLMTLTETVEDFTAEIYMSESISKSWVPSLTYNEDNIDSPTRSHDMLLKFVPKSGELCESIVLTLSSPINLSKSIVRLLRTQSKVSLILKKADVYDVNADPYALPKWPKGRLTTTIFVMFSPTELGMLDKFDGSKIGFDVSFALRHTLYDMFMFVLAHGKVCYLVSSTQTGVILYSEPESTRMMGDTQPVLVVHFRKLNDGDPHFSDVIGSKVTSACSVNSVECANEEMLLFVELLRANARALPKTDRYRSRTIGGVKFKCSFLAPLYASKVAGNIDSTMDRMRTKPKVESEQKEFDLSQNLLSKKSSSDKVAGKSAPECDHCAKQLPINSSRCSRCHSTFYCGRKCQRNGWKKHKSVCG